MLDYNTRHEGAVTPRKAAAGVSRSFDIRQAERTVAPGTIESFF